MHAHMNTYTVMCFLCLQIKVWLPVLGVFNVHKMLMLAIAHEGCTGTIKESALKAD